MANRLTKRTVDALAMDRIAWDGEVKGFGVRHRATGKFYLVKYRFKGRQRWYTIGRHGSPWTVEEARKEAKTVLGQVADGLDPAEARDRDKADRMTVADLCDLYLKEGRGAKKPSTIATDKGRIERHIKPLLGRKIVSSITPVDVRRFLRDVAEGKSAADVKTKPRGRARVRGGKGTATRTVGLLGGIFTFAVAEGLLADNPVRDVERYADRKLERYLTGNELRALGGALEVAEAEGENPTAIAAIRLLALTGCRKSEILSLRWDEVEFQHGCLRLGDSKTGAKVVPLGAPALAILSGLPRIEGNPYVLPGEKEGEHIVGVPRVWQRVRVRAGLADVRLHDLRHTVASVGAASGLGLPIIGKLLGHKDVKTTQRYAHIGDDPARMAANRISETIAAAMGSAPSETNVQQLDQTKRR